MEVWQQCAGPLPQERKVEGPRLHGENCGGIPATSVEKGRHPGIMSGSVPLTCHALQELDANAHASCIRWLEPFASWRARPENSSSTGHGEGRKRVRGRQSVAAKVQDREGLAGYSGSSWLSESNTSSSFPTLILLGAWLRKTFRSMQHGSLIDSRGEHRLRKNKLWFYVPQMAS